MLMNDDEDADWKEVSNDEHSWIIHIGLQATTHKACVEYVCVILTIILCREVFS